MKNGKLGYQKSEISEPIRITFDVVDYVGDYVAPMVSYYSRVFW